MRRRTYFIGWVEDILSLFFCHKNQADLYYSFVNGLGINFLKKWIQTTTWLQNTVTYLEIMATFPTVGVVLMVLYNFMENITNYFPNIMVLSIEYLFIWSLIYCKPFQVLDSGSIPVWITLERGLREFLRENFFIL